MTDEYEGDDCSEKTKEPWHLSRSVPVTLIVVILLQTVGLLLEGGAALTRLGIVEARVETVITNKQAASEHKFLQIQITNNDETDTEIKEGLKEGFREMGAKLDRVIERMK